MHAHTPALIAAVVLAAPAFAQVQAPVARDAIVAKHLTPLIDAYLIPGAMVGLYHDGELSFHPIGTLNYDTDQTPGNDTLYEFGSIGKVITGTFFADAIRRGEVTRNTTLQELVPEHITVVKGRAGTEIELWHLTTHSSGWGGAPINLLPKDIERPFAGYTKDMLYPAMGTTPLMFEPGEGFTYSNFAVGTLGTVLADHLGGEYEALVKERVLEPLAIRDMAITLSEEQESRLAPPTSAGRTSKTWHDPNPFAPAGLWVTSAPQLMTFAMANIAPVEDDAPTIYESLTMAQQPLYFAESMQQQVCFGWFIARDGQSHWHNGMTAGFSSYMGINNELDIAVVVLTNGATFQTTVAGEKLFQELAGMNPEPVALSRPDPISDELASRIVGTYKSALGFNIEIIVEHAMLYARVTNQTFNRLHPIEGVGRFRYDGIDAELGFELLEGDKPAPSVTLYQNGAEMKCVRLVE
jgi:CubicO group peptidase (beta-lactamase class C family)